MGKAAPDGNPNSALKEPGGPWASKTLSACDCLHHDWLPDTDGSNLHCLRADMPLFLRHVFLIHLQLFSAFRRQSEMLVHCFPSVGFSEINSFLVSPLFVSLSLGFDSGQRPDLVCLGPRSQMFLQSLYPCTPATMIMLFGKESGTYRNWPKISFIWGTPRGRVTFLVLVVLCFPPACPVGADIHTYKAGQEVSFVLSEGIMQSTYLLSLSTSSPLPRCNHWILQVQYLCLYKLHTLTHAHCTPLGLQLRH